MNIFAFDFKTNAITPLSESGDPPATRTGHGLLPIGNGMMLLYGGQDPEDGTKFADMWHIRVHMIEQDVHYTQRKFKGKHEHYILAWRQGFTLHWLDPI